VPVTVTGFVTPLIIKLAVERDLAIAVEADVLGSEAELGVPLGVEEVGRLQMG